MIKLINGSQMKLADLDGITAKAMRSIDLMETAAKAFTGVFCGLIPEKSRSILVICGTGNNGGDGLAIARMLQYSGYSDIEVNIVNTAAPESEDFFLNLQRLNETPILFKHIHNFQDFTFRQEIVIDAVLGSGMNRPLSHDIQLLVQQINRSGKPVIAVDCPTGFRCDGKLIKEESVLMASDVISFQRPKLNFFFPESEKGLAHFHVVDIGLRENFIDSLPSNYHLIEPADISKRLKMRSEFSHKGTYGHALIYAGSKGKSGAALIAAEACIYSGAGLTSVGFPAEDRLALHSRLPEAMFVDMESDWESVKGKFKAIAFGPGLGDSPRFIESVLACTSASHVIDADGLNYLARHTDLLKHLRYGSILTPHMKEFDRLFGESESWFARLELARVKAKEHHVYIVLKNRYTFIVLPDGRVLINPSGNPAMASGGMGDALTGMLASFLAQGYNQEDCCILACFIHGRAGDILKSAGNAVVTASTLISTLPLVIGELQSS